MRSLLLFSVLLMTHFMASADIIYVNKNNTNSTQNGTSWETAYPSIVKATKNASQYDEVWVAQGDYRFYDNPCFLGEHKGTILIDNPGIEVYGGFNGTETERNQRDFENNVTIVNRVSRIIPTPNIASAPITTVDGFTAYNTYDCNGTERDEFWAFVGNDLSMNYANMNFFGPFSGGHSVTSLVDIHSKSYHNCTFYEGFSLGFEEEHEWQTFTFSATNCSFLASGEMDVEFIHCDMTNCVISGCETALLGQDATFNNCLILNNTFNQNFDTGEYWMALTQECNFINCTITQNTFNRPIAFSTITNSIFHNNDASLDENGNAVFESGNCTVLYSCVTDQDHTTGFQNIGADPEFINPANLNFRLAECSPLIDQGLGVGPDPYDLAGNTRVVNQLVDLGCYEQPIAYPTRLYVDRDATGSNDGTSWGNAFTELRDALDNACSRTEIWVAEGAYFPHVSVLVDREASFELLSGMTIYGGFDGTEGNLLLRDVENNETILSAATGAFGIADNNYHVVDMLDGELETILDGFTIFGGNADGAGLNSQGGGILVRNTNARIENCFFNNNHALLEGGAIKANSQNEVVISNCEFTGNDANQGGAVSSDGGNDQNATLDRCTFYQNEADAGGAVETDQETIISNCLFYLNDATGTSKSDGVFNNATGDLLAINSTFYDNDDKAIVNNGTLELVSSIIYLHDEYPVDNFGTQTISHTLAGVGFPGQNNTSGNPLFVDPSNFDFRIQPTSPGINIGGYRTASGSLDLGQEVRVVAGDIDAGCFENQTGCSNDHDTCLDAIPFSLDDGFLETEVSTDCASNFEVGPSSCGAVTRDVWAKFDYYPTGISVKVTPLEGQDVQIALYAGECGNLTELACVNDNGLDENEVIELANLSDVDVIYVRIGMQSDDEGFVDISVTPLDCSILNAVVDVPSLCFDLDGQALHEREVTLVYNNMPTDAYIKISGEDLAFPMYFQKDVSPQPILLSNLPANNEELSITVEFISELVEGCSNTFVDIVPPFCCTAPRDECAGALPLLLYTVHEDKLDCSTFDDWVEAPCIASAGRDNWYTFVAPEEGAVEIQTGITALTNGNCNLRHTIFEGTCGNLSVVNCANDEGDNIGEISYTEGLTPGETYYLRVSAWQNQQCDFDILIQPYIAQGCLGDFDNSGAIDTSDLLFFLADFGCTSNCVANLAGNEAVDTTDLLAFLVLFGTQCD